MEAGKRAAPAVTSWYASVPERFVRASAMSGDFLPVGSLRRLRLGGGPLRRPHGLIGLLENAFVQQLELIIQLLKSPCDCVNDETGDDQQRPDGNEVNGEQSRWKPQHQAGP